MLPRRLGRRIFWKAFPRFNRARITCYVPDEAIFLRGLDQCFVQPLGQFGFSEFGERPRECRFMRDLLPAIPAA